MNEHEEHVLQDPIELGVAHDEEQQQPHIEQALEAPKWSQRVRKSTIPNDYEVYDTEEFQIEGDPTSFEEAMRSTRSLKWLEALQDEMRSMSTNKVWNLEIIPKGAKTVGCKWVYKIKYDSKGNVERF
jgi:hydroxymethylpyrimidine pyrophosphatase-like HAD family hydrolase